jgi:hypothetical protein
MGRKRKSQVEKRNLGQPASLKVERYNVGKQKRRREIPRFARNDNGRCGDLQEADPT